MLVGTGNRTRHTGQQLMEIHYSFILILRIYSQLTLFQEANSCRAASEVVISNHTTDGLVSLNAEGVVVSLDLYRSAVIVYD